MGKVYDLNGFRIYFYSWELHNQIVEMHLKYLHTQKMFWTFWSTWPMYFLPMWSLWPCLKIAASHVADLPFTLCLCCITFSYSSHYLSSNCIWVQIYKSEGHKTRQTNSDISRSLFRSVSWCILMWLLSKSLCETSKWSCTHRNELAKSLFLQWWITALSQPLCLIRLIQWSDTKTLDKECEDLKVARLYIIFSCF